ncbi:MAG: hypothetical protein GY800_11385, partial [Planctomycetes bacterium]|nr:hypothetical protein [Planctomycetota bacterium]
VDESEYGKALYSNSAYGATPQGLDAAIAKGGQGAFDPQGGTFSQVGNQNQPGGTPSSNNPYGRSDETQAQIERNVAGINRQIMDNREIHELRMGQKQVTGPFSGRGGGIASEARARAIGDTGAYGKAGSGFGYGPGGVGDDGSGDFFRGKAAALLRRMPSGKAGDRSKRKEMFKQVAAYTSLANNRDGMLAKEAGNKDAKEMFSDKLEAEAGRDEQELAQQQAQFGQAMFQESDQFNRGLDQDQANADRQFGLDEYLAKNPKQKQQSLIQIPGRDVQIGDDGTVLQEGSPSYVYDPNRGTTTGFGAQGPFTPGAVDPVEAQMQAELDSIKANFAADPKKYPEELSLKLIAETRAKYGR